MESIAIYVNTLRSFRIDLSDCLLSNCFLDAHIQLTGKTNTRTVDLPQNVAVFLISRPVKNEISSPDQRGLLLIKSILNQVDFAKEEINQKLPLFRLIVSVFSAREQCSREGISIICWLLVNHKDRLSSDHHNSDFSFFDSGQEGHIYQHSLISNNILLAEFHKVAESFMLNMVVFSFSKLKFCIERKSISCLIGSFILNDYSPDSLSSGSSVLLQNSLAVRKSFGEALFEIRNIVVDIGVFWDKSSFVKFDQSGLSSKVHHGIRVGHADKSSF